MPLYDFECSDCQIVLERVQPFVAAPPWCPKCAKQMKRKITFPAQVNFGKVPPSLRKKSFGSAPYAHG